MSESNPYRPMIARHAALLREGAALPLGGLQPLDLPSPSADASKALIFAPHPDDECIIGGLPLRLLRELGMKVINVAVTLGSRRERQAERWRELEGA
ncbi:MAG: PIG-L family deacetylase, partial [Nitrospirota bacterium]|nr:PIG-L family deacetylase [Nitrospirota bacterium]